MSKLQPKVKKLYYSIGEVSDLTKLKAYVLRYWETEFVQLSPPKNRAGNRTYRQKDIDMIFKIKDLLYSKRFTIDGARKMLQEEESTDRNITKNSRYPDKKRLIIKKIKEDLTEILSIIKE